MRRPAVTLETLSGSPLMHARRANAAGIEGVPRVAALARPQITLRRRPAAQWAANSRPRRAGSFLIACASADFRLDDGGRLHR